MTDAQTPNDTRNEPVAITLQLDAQVYQFFLQKANRAGIEIEPYLSSTLSVVLGCRVFNETNACSSQIFRIAGAQDTSNVQP